MRKKEASSTTTKECAAGQSVEEWAHDAGISRPTFYNLPEDCRPDCVKIGRRTIVREQARDWLARMAKRGGVQLKHAA